MNLVRNILLYSVFNSLLCIACNTQNTTTQTSEDTTLTASPETTSTTTCYQQVSGKDSVRIQLTTTGDKVTGELVYSLFEKDRNTGTFAGQLNGDTIFADYTFQSEGTTSVREIALLKKGNTLIEGYGDVKDEGGKMVFVNKNALNFEGKMVLEETPCQ